jgi:FHA domain
MPKMIVSIDDVVIKEVQLTKDRTTLGRRPYNDIVIDNLAVSGEHAAILMSGADVVLEDLNSTNGSYVNGKAIKKQALQNGDSIEIGKYKIKFVGDQAADNFDKTMVVRPARCSTCATSGSRPACPGFPRVCTCRARARQRRPSQHQGADRRCRRARSPADQGGDHHRQAGCGRGRHYQTPPRLCGAPCGRWRQPQPEWHAHHIGSRAAEKW